ncbi:MAG: hypothetical protein ACLGI2_02985, partial [Acidimicrobiia bacterium]
MSRRVAVSIALGVAALGVPATAGAETAWVDASMGGRPVTVDLGPGSDVATALAVQPDGKVVVVGTADTRGDADMAVLRFHPDGRLDSTFGAGGKVLVGAPDSRQGAAAVALQPDGKIVVAGSAEAWNGFQVLSRMAVVRLDASGRPDPTFNGGELLVLGHRTAMSSAAAVALQPDGKIVVAGSGSVHNDTTRRVSDVMVARVTATGAVDTGFGDNGVVLTDMDGYENYDGASAVALRPDGRIVAAGTTSQASFSGAPPIRHVLVQHLSTGALDPTFGNGGTIVDGENGALADAALLPDGTLVGVGDRQFTAGVRSRSVAVTRYRPIGGVDPSFGTGGRTVTHAPPTARADSGTVFNGNSFGGAVAVDGRGRLVVAGAAYGFTSMDLAVVRYNRAGALDTAFGRAGWMKTDVGGDYDQLNAVGILPDGRIVTAGRTGADDDSRFVFAVYPASDAPSPAAAWGWNPVGQVGDGTTTDRSTPTPVAGSASAAALAGGAFHSLALDDGGQVPAWGWNGAGQLGDGTTTDRHQPAVVPGLSGVARIGAGYYHSLAVQSGVVKAWGWNPLGQLGDGTTVDRHRPVTVPGLDRVAGVAAGAYHNLGVRSDGTVWAWGWNGVGQLGDGTTVDRSRPVQVAGLSDIVAVSAGAFHSLALGSDGSVWAWGWNAVGQLGNALSTEDSARPVRAMWPGVVAISAGAFHNLALKGDGTVWAWGYNGLGAVGDGTSVDRRWPVQV